MRTARISLFHGSNQPFEIYECDIELSNLGEVLVQVNLATICDLTYTPLLGAECPPIPCILGHEVVGQIAGLTQSTLTASP